MFRSREERAAPRKIASQKPFELMASSLVLTVGILWPLVSVIASGSTLTGSYEESIGYRYFYSLRQLYDPAQYLFLPQGQFPSLVHRAIQAILSLVYAPTNLFPRIDVFTYSGVAIAHVATIAAFIWAMRPKVLDGIRIPAAIFWTLPFYIYGFHGNYILLSLDYMAWIPSVALLAAGILHRFAWELRPWSYRATIGLGVFAGYAVAIKMTLVIFPVVIGLVLLAPRIGRWNMFRHLLLSALIGLAIAFALLVLYLGKFAFVSDFFNSWMIFLPSATGASVINWSDFFSTLFTSHGQWGFAFICILPVTTLALALATKSWRTRFILVALSLGAVIYAVIVTRRYTAATIFEAGLYFSMGLWVVSTIFSRDSWLKTKTAPIFATVFLGMLSAQVVFTGQNLLPFYFLNNIKTNTAAQKTLASHLNKASKPIAFLIPDNSWRLISVHSAIYKGSSTIFGDGGPSSLLEKMFRNFDFFRRTKKASQNGIPIVDFPTIVFTVRKVPGKNNTVAYGLSQLPRRISEIEKNYKIKLGSYNCADVVDFSENVDVRFVVICRQKTIQAASLPTRRLSFPVLGSGRSFPTKATGKIFLSRLFSRLPSIGRVRVMGKPGDRLLLKDVGPWNPIDKGFYGLEVKHGKHGWYFDLKDWPTASPHIVLGAPPLSPFWISPAEVQGSVQVMRDETGPFLRVTAGKNAPYLSASGNVPMPQLNGAPFSLLAEVRVPAGRSIILTITNATMGGKNEGKVFIIKHALPSTWVTGLVRSKSIHGRGTSGNYSVGLGMVKAGEWFDVRFVGAYSGIIP
jgi:hypothetical protein